MSKTLPTPPIQLDYSIDKDSIADYQAFISDVKQHGVRALRCGQFNYIPGEDYQAMPVRITTNSNNVYELTVPLALDPLGESDEEMIPQVIEDVEARMKDAQDDMEDEDEESVD